MKVLFYMPSPFYEPHFGALLDEAERLRREGNEVHLLVSNGAFDKCDISISNDSDSCIYCAKYADKIIHDISKDFIIHKIRKYIDKRKKYTDYKYASAADIKKIEYKGAKIGFACLSTYISRTRNLDPVINRSTKNDFDFLLFQSRKLTDAIEEALNEIKPELVYLHNGRFFDCRPVLDIALKNNINARCVDGIRFADGYIVKQISQNTVLHNIKGNTLWIDHSWSTKDVLLKKKISLAHDFFRIKKRGTFINERVYIKLQKRGLLPSGFNSKKRNIVIFSSSEDEYASIDDEYEKLSLFKSQMEGLEYIFKTFKNNNDIQFYLRIHPNLSGIKYKYHTDLYLFQKKYKNVTVIPPSSKISSYDLLDAAEKVITFGSSMGVEAAYWGKPSILLSGAVYYYLNACYIPKKPEQLKRMIVSKLKPLDKKGTYKYGFYMMYKNPEMLYKYVDFTQINFNLFGWNFASYNYKKLFGSSKLFAVHQAFIQRLFNHTERHVIKF